MSTAGISSASPPCERLAAHLVELELAKASQALPRPDVEQLRATASSAMRETFLPRCRSELSATDVECQLAAHDLSALRACQEPRP
jgi:hypothetical protein